MAIKDYSSLRGKGGKGGGRKAPTSITVLWSFQAQGASQVAGGALQAAC